MEFLEMAAYRAWALASLVVVAKMMAVGVYTSVLRVRAKTYASPEDYVAQGHPVPDAPDPEVERARRIHRNDLENGVPFFVVGAIYAGTDPSALGLAVAFVGFPFARCLHTFWYARARMPHRTWAYGAGFFITVWMGVVSAIELLTA